MIAPWDIVDAYVTQLQAAMPAGLTVVVAEGKDQVEALLMSPPAVIVSLESFQGEDPITQSTAQQPNEWAVSVSVAARVTRAPLADGSDAYSLLKAIIEKLTPRAGFRPGSASSCTPAKFRACEQQMLLPGGSLYLLTFTHRWLP